MGLGLPIPFAFLVIDFVGAFLWMGGVPGVQAFVLSFFQTLANFNLASIPFFILMGEVIFLSGMASRALDALDKWIGAIPGRLGLLTTVAGVLFGTFSGSVLANTATLGSLLVPEMRRKGYSKMMSLGPVLGAGGLAARSEERRVGKECRL